MRARAALLLLLTLASARLVAAQDHEHHAPTDSTAADHGRRRVFIHPRPTARPMSSMLMPRFAMMRDGSGTSWLPDAAPMEAVHGGTEVWSLMLHGAAFPRYTAHDAFESGSRGDAAFGAPNWVMGMAQRDIGHRGQLTMRAMLSLDPLTEGGNGYPLLFQSGETWQGQRLVDRQHPHDLFSELSVTYAHRVYRETSFFGYVAYPGEPAIGPVAFMHRPSARYNPDSPLSHHWQDATHILFGVATVGVANRRFKLEQSIFTGAEPDEERWGFDEPKFDSYATRLSYSPTPRLTLQLSRAWLHAPEALEPDVDQVRTTAAALFSRRLGPDRDLSVSLIWGANDAHADSAEADHHGRGIQHAILAEAALKLDKYALHGRLEYTRKSPGELALDPHDVGEDPFDLVAFTLGVGRSVFRANGLSAIIGAQATTYAVPERLTDLYGSRPVSLQLYLRLAPVPMRHSDHPAEPAHRGH